MFGGSLAVDYAGWRILASALLPIGEGTLVYGSDDGGKTVCGSSPLPSFVGRCADLTVLRFPQVHKDPEVHSLMAEAADKLKLKLHPVGGLPLPSLQAKHERKHAQPRKTNADSKVELYGPVDIEVHRGKDGRFYVLDTARLFPPLPVLAHRESFISLSLFSFFSLSPPFSFSRLLSFFLFLLFFFFFLRSLSPLSP